MAPQFAALASEKPLRLANDIAESCDALLSHSFTILLYVEKIE
jgi:hypothetical protein